jgi:hypothetical protein
MRSMGQSRRTLRGMLIERIRPSYGVFHTSEGAGGFSLPNKAIELTMALATGFSCDKAPGPVKIRKDRR